MVTLPMVTLTMEPPAGRRPVVSPAISLTDSEGLCLRLCLHRAPICLCMSVRLYYYGYTSITSISAWAKQRQHRPMCCVNEYAIFLHVMMMLPRPANCSSFKKSLMRSVSAESPSSNGTRAPS